MSGRRKRFRFLKTDKVIFDFLRNELFAFTTVQRNSDELSHTKHLSKQYTVLTLFILKWRNQEELSRLKPPSFSLVP